MRGREELNQKMAEISQFEDAKNDSFATLFTRSDAENEPIHQKDQNDQYDETDFMRRFRQVRSQNHKQDHSQERKQNHLQDQRQHHRKNGDQPSRRVRPNNSKKVQTMYAIPVAGVVVCGVFLVGFYGGNIAGNQIKAVNQTFPVMKKEQVTNVASGVQAVRSPQKTRSVNTIIPQTKRAADSSGFSGAVNGRRVGLARNQAGTITTARLQIGSQTQSSLLPPATRQDAISLLLIAGRQLEKQGDVTGARENFKKAALAGNSSAALALARSYDRRSVNIGAELANSKLAREWYEKWFLMATEKGEISSRARYDRLLKGINPS